MTKTAAQRISAQKKRRTNPVRRWGSAPAAWVELFNALAAGLGEHRKMFGYPCAFVNGNMFAGLFETGLFLRLPESERVAFLNLKGAARFEPVPGRVMREYVVAPADMVQHPAVVAKWLRRELDYGFALPAKTRKARLRH